MLLFEKKKVYLAKFLGFLLSRLIAHTKYACVSNFRNLVSVSVSFSFSYFGWYLFWYLAFGAARASPPPPLHLVYHEIIYAHAELQLYCDPTQGYVCFGGQICDNNSLYKQLMICSPSRSLFLSLIYHKEGAAGRARERPAQYKLFRSLTAFQLFFNAKIFQMEFRYSPKWVE